MTPAPAVTPAPAMTPAPAVSVVVATYNREPALLTLLSALTEQTYPSFEVVVVDDGSARDVRAACTPFETRLALRVERQSNAGAAAARQRGAELARGRIVLFLDDDMAVGPTFVAAHAARHAAGGETDRVVLGRILPPDTEALSLYERFFAEMLRRLAEGARKGDEALTGSALYTGNVSLPRELFFRVGGFDTTFRALEDAELGVRLARAGARFELAEEAASVHGADSPTAEAWLRRAHRDGVYATRVAKKHRLWPDASPYRHLGRVSPVSRPWLWLALGAPSLAAPLARAALYTSSALDGTALTRLALAGATFVYGLEYYRGVADEAGDLGEVLRGYGEFRRGLARLASEDGAREPRAVAFVEAVVADHQALVRSQDRYGQGAPPRGLLGAAVQNAGFQLLVGLRFARLLHGVGLGLGAKFTTRLLRHLYGSDVHWEADLAPGIVLVHGFGLALAPGARVGEGCILFQNVTLGTSLDPKTRVAGAPRLEPNVHVGVGATLLGPIVVGQGSKIMPGCVVRASLPARSLVESPEPAVRPRS